MALYDEPLLVTHPQLAAEWSDKNEITPNDVTAGAHDRVWWNPVYDKYDNHYDKRIKPDINL